MRHRSGGICLVVGVLLSTGLHERAIPTDSTLDSMSTHDHR
jgi:hypothetical protein